jgi:predicted DsbA family dithiol-disulfide isomerase
MKVEVYSDIMCPWCYIGERRFSTALAAYAGARDVEVVFRPYQLDPSLSSAGVPVMRYLERRFGGSAAAKVRQMTETARGEGITMDYERAIAVNTRNAHLVLQLAEREYGPNVQLALAERLFDAHFSQGANVSAPETLSELAAAVGMDAAEVRRYLGSEEAQRELENELAKARELGVRAVPTFVFDGQFAVEGAQPVSVMLQALDQISASLAEASVGTDDCVDGACGTDAGD